MAETLQYNKPHMIKYDFEILRGDEIAGRLTYEGIRHRKAAASMDGLDLYITRTGAIKTDLSVTASGSDNVIATYHQGAMDNSGQLVVGATEYTFRSTGKMLSPKSRYSWIDHEGNELITYHMGVIRNAGKIAVSDAAMASQDRQLLIPIGLFNSLAWDQDSAAVAGS